MTFARNTGWSVVLLLLLACGDDALNAPLPGVEPTWLYVRPAGSGAADTGACATPADADADGWDRVEDGGGDCDDADANVHPFATDPPGDGVDANCDGTDAGEDRCVPTGLEACNGLDDDCDGLVDDPWLLHVEAPAVTAARGALLAEGGMAFVVGLAGGGGTPDGRVEVYDRDSVLVVRIDGTGQSATFGTQLATGRDLTGDGVVDLVVAAPYASVGDVPNRGRVVVFPGPLSASTTVADALTLLEGGDLDGQAGGQLALLPDLDGDGLADIAIGDYRHALLLSGVPGPAADAAVTPYGIARAWADVEWDTGGGAWTFAVTADGEGAPQLAFGMPTWGGGVGTVGVYDAATLRGHRTLADAAWAVVGDKGAGLGDALTAVDGGLWSIAAGALASVSAEGVAPTPILASALASAGDQDGDGREDIALVTPDGLAVGDAATATSLAVYPLAVTLQTARAGLPPLDDDGDGRPDLPVLAPSRAALLSGAVLLAPPCNADGDLLSSAQGDCDDLRADVAPAFGVEVCDGVDDDCDGLVDEEDLLALNVRARQVAGLGDLDGDGTAELGALDMDGLLVALDGEDARVRFTLTGVREDAAAAFTGAGDPDGNGFRDLLVATAEDAWLLPAGETGAVEDLATVRFRDTTGWWTAGPVGTAGDIDGDGLDDPWLLLRAPAGALAIGVYAGVGVGTVVVDSAAVLYTAPESWDLVNVASARPGAGGADVDGDGLQDLVVADPRSAYGAGRAYVLLGGAEGVQSMDSAAALLLYGDTREELGTAVAMGDLDGDGRADVALAGTSGTRVLSGASCPLFGPRVPFVATSLAFADLDGDGADALYMGNAAAGAYDQLGGVIAVGDGSVWRAGITGDALGALLVGVGDVDGVPGGDLVYTRGGEALRAGGACP